MSRQSLYAKNNLADLLKKLGDGKLQDYASLERALTETPDGYLGEDEEQTISTAIISLGCSKDTMQEDLAKKLISKINPDLFKDEHHFDIVHAASNNRLSPKILTALIEAGFKTDAPDAHGRTPLSLFREQIKADVSPPKHGSPDHQILTVLEGGSAQLSTSPKPVSATNHVPANCCIIS